MKAAMQRCFVKLPTTATFIRCMMTNMIQTQLTHQCKVATVKLCERSLRNPSRVAIPAEQFLKIGMTP